MCGPNGSGASGRGFPVNGTSAIALPPNGNRTETDVRLLAAAERRDEIARMLGGAKITAPTRAHAESMLRSATAA